MASVQQTLVRPRPLAPGDRIAIVSPAGAVDHSLFAPAIDMMQAQGWETVRMPHAMGRMGAYSGTVKERADDMARAILDPQVRAIMCGRGGYGAVHLLPILDQLPLADDSKWLIGFSDISALHGLWHAHGIQSIHGPMLRGLSYCIQSGDMRQCEALFALLRGEQMRVEWGGDEHNRPGVATGMLLGGNFSVLDALVGTKYDLLRRDCILFLEDVNEPIYKIERMLWHLRLRGVLTNLKGLILGQFTNAEPDANYPSVYAMIAQQTADCSFPIAYGATIGHKGLNLPLIEGAEINMAVSRNKTALISV